MSSINRSGRPTRVVDDMELPAKIRNAMLIHNDLQPHVAVLDRENIDIPGKKHPHRSLIKRIQHQQESEFDGQVMGNLVQVVQPNKPQLNHTNEQKREEFCE